MFRHPKLNRILVVKHQLRQQEKINPVPRGSVVTKLIVPVDPDNLTIGGHYIFVGELNWLTTLEQTIGSLSRFESDLALLMSLDRVPSFDPFLLREWIGREGFHPSSGYFSVNEADATKMEAFVLDEISALVSVALGGQGNADGARNLARKMMRPTGQDDLSALRATLHLSVQEFAEGLFCWRGFLFYKWNLSRISEQLPTMLQELQRRVRACRTAKGGATEMEHARRRVTKRIIEICQTAEDILRDYDRAYAALTTLRDPARFRSFLLSAPTIFIELGGTVGQVNHVLQFWKYRVSRSPSGHLSPADLDDLLRDFEDGLATGPLERPV